MVLFPILFFAVYFFENENYMKSALLFAVENAIKPFTVLFLFLFLFKKKYKEFFISLFTSLFFIVWGFVILKGNVFSQVSVFIKSLANFNGVYVYMPKYALTNTSSVFTALKFLLCCDNKIISIPVLVFYYKFFSLFASVLVLITLFFEKTFWKKIALLTISFCMLPTIIYDYKLVFLLIPLWLFVNSDKRSRFDVVYSVLFGLLLIPKQFFIYLRTFPTGTEMATYGCIVNPILMLIFTGLIIYECITELKHD